MLAARILALFALFALLPLFAACQVFERDPATPSTAGLTRMQGELTAIGDKLLFQPCNDQRNYVVNDTGGTSILQEAASLAGQQGALFADLRGKFSGVASGTQGQVELQQLYRVERSTSACDDPDFKRMILRANGHKPAWALNVTNKGMVLQREGQPPCRCLMWKSNWVMAASTSPPKPTASRLNCGSRPSAASTASAAACNT